MFDRIFWGYRDWYLRSPRLLRSVVASLLVGLLLMLLILLMAPLTRFRIIMLGVTVVAFICVGLFDRRGPDREGDGSGIEEKESEEEKAPYELMDLLGKEGESPSNGGADEDEPP